MNNSSTMAVSIKSKKQMTQAAFITFGFVIFFVLLMFLLKWPLPVFEKSNHEPALEVELNLPDDLPQPTFGGGGGGGNPVEASGPAGTAPENPPAPGTNEDSKDIVTDDNDHEAPPVSKPVNPKPVNKVVTNNAPPTKAKPVVEAPPAPAKPKAVLGKTTGGSATGGGTSSTYDRAGGSGTGNAVGNGSGSGGGTGSGTGGGNGSGSGRGTGPSRVSGSRTLINPKPMNAGENIEGRIRAEIKVSADGSGTFIRATGGSLMSNRQAVEIVRDWLRRNKFNKTETETTEVYDFNIKLGG